MSETVTESKWKRTSRQEALHATQEKSSSSFRNSLVWSFLLALFSVANPLFSDLATNLQEQILYTGWAMHQGQIVYANIYGTGGILFYLLVWLGSSYQGTVLLSLFQLLLFYISGRQAYRLAFSISQQPKVATASLHFFYFLVLVLGVGGLYAPLIALPFLLLALNFLVKFARDQRTDRSFLKYGFLAAIILMIDPFVGTFFFGINFLYLLFVRIRKGEWGTGLSQLLYALIGFSLFFYPLGYYTVWNGTFGQALNQATYIWQSLSINPASQLVPLLVYLVILLGLGLPISLLGLTRTESTVEKRFFLPLGALGSLGIWLIASSQAEFSFHQLLPGLVYFWLIQVFVFARMQEMAQYGRHKKGSRKPLFRRYLSSYFYLPLWTGGILLLLPLANQLILERGVEAERQDVVTYIKKEADRSDSIYAWDTKASWYQETGKLSASAILSPSYYLNLPENQIRLVNELDTDHPRYIVVRKDLGVLDTMQQELKESYSEIDTKLTYFRLYERN